jgi:hypothetical protein
MDQALGIQNGGAARLDCADSWLVPTVFEDGVLDGWWQQ